MMQQTAGIRALDDKRIELRLNKPFALLTHTLSDWCFMMPERTANRGPARPTPIEVWHQDEARVGQQGTLAYLWADQGSRPSVKRDLRYKWAYIFGAVCAERGVGAAIVVPKADAYAMGLHLAEISGQVAPGAHAVVVLDGAGWHKPGKRLRVPDNISLLHLPPYSPELNPQENIWQYLRQNFLSNRRLHPNQRICRQRAV